VENGIVETPRIPRGIFFRWDNPDGRDLVVFLGEEQPPLGKYPLCRQVIAYARELGVDRVFTFAAMASGMRLGQRPRVFGAATDRECLGDLERLELEVLEDGNISGLNGVLLGAAAEAGLRGACLLGEMPQDLSELPFPRASLSILESFAALAGIDLDFTELAEQASEAERQLEELLAEAEQEEGEEVEREEDPGEEEGRLRAADRQRIERLFGQASADRSKAFALKQELDRLGAFEEYEDRFLDLFRPAGG